MIPDRHMAKSKCGKYVSCTGEFYPKNKEKYKGSSLPKFKSRLEYNAFLFMDRSPNVIEWSYESTAIEYIDPTKRSRDRKKMGRKRKYYIDIIATIKRRDGTQKVWIEVKSKRETIAPKPSSRKSPRNKKLDQEAWLRNNAKWKYARMKAKRMGYEFIILTEDHLK